MLTHSPNYSTDSLDVVQQAILTVRYMVRKSSSTQSQVKHAYSRQLADGLLEPAVTKIDHAYNYA